MLGIGRLLICCAPLALAACGTNEARARVSFWAREPLTVSLVRVEITDGRQAYRLGSADFRHRGGSVYDGPDVRTAHVGTLRVAYALVTADNDTVSAGALDLPLRSDWRYGIAIIPDSLDPTRHCFGCLGSRAFALAAPYRIAASDSVYMVWGGNSIQNPVAH